MIDENRLLKTLMDYQIKDYIEKNNQTFPQILNYLIHGALFLLACYGIYFSTYVLITTIKEKLEPEIKSGEELDQVVEEEKKKLGLTKTVIPLTKDELNEFIRTLSSEEVKEIMGNNSIESKQELISSLEALKNKTIGIKLGEGYLIHFSTKPRRYLVKHELYHIKTGYFDKISEKNLSYQDMLKIYIQYLLVEEPKAFFYSIFNIKL
jgi:hypothetical protein